MTDGSGYLDRRKARVAALKLKQQIVFGYGIGAALFLWGTVNCYLVVESWHSLWRSLMWIGIWVFLLTLVFPSIWVLPEQGFRWLTGKIGHHLFLFLLSVSYWLLIWPAGWWLRRRQGSAPIWEWTEGAPDGERWQKKNSLTISPRRTAKRQRPLLVQPFAVIAFFIEHRNYVLVPVVVILLALGVILFFAQTSVLAPFIYTLF